MMSRSKYVSKTIGVIQHAFRAFLSIPALMSRCRESGADNFFGALRLLCRFMNVNIKNEAVDRS
jgi:hypothetical protein